MEKEYIRPSSNGYNRLEGYTKTLYGERGTFRHNLERYIYGDDFQSACRTPKTIDEIPELTFEIIKNQIKREEYFLGFAEHIIEIFSQRQNNGELTDDDYYEVAGIMGLCPGHCDWHETLFPHLVDLFVSSEEDGKKILQDIANKPNIVCLMVLTMTDGLRRGQIIRYNGRDMLSQGYARNYFRGENAYNVRCEPAMFRNLPKDKNQNKIEQIIRCLRMIEFSLWLNTLEFIRHWPFGDIFHGAIAQHYGIPTNGIDITSDLKTALFFACCKYENHIWRPLRPDEYKTKNSRREIEKRGGDSRYGIIFTAPADAANMSTAANIPELHLTSVTPVGFQPFMRCSSQSAYMIEAGYPYDLFLDPGFEKFKFRLSPEICEWIYREMDGGNKVYPQEMFGSCDDIVENIKHRTTFSERAFNNTIKQMKLNVDKESIRKALGEHGINIISTVNLCSAERKEKLEKNYWKAYSKSIYNSMPGYLRIEFSI